ncbi:MAG: ubiquinone biosynthesis hydroxylase [Rhizobiaceae bacterium]|nr:ubiquinone biosynthesis hydroxylase [Hyphomicrobiales bacterium]NRB30829.1 ubiquinone biosynthesis hydroxylase [Rhizobiaceae bacterium]
MTQDHANYDCVIAGGGYVGLSTAVAIKASAPHLKIMLIDAAPEAAILKDERASAIAAAASRMLDQLGLWSELVEHAQPIHEMIVTDSRAADPVRPVFLTFGQALAEGEEMVGDEPFAHMLPNRALVTALRAKAAELGVDLRHEDAVVSFETADPVSTVELSSGQVVSARLLIAADGVKSKLRDLAGIKTVHWSYDQMGIVTTVAHERPHHGRAEEHFLPSGPFATLPLPGNRSSLVWTEPTDNAKRLMAADDFTFELELEQRFGHKLGDIEVAGPRKAFPLGLTLARDFVRPRFALVGDAAHGIHPIAGQGLNLGFKDAAALAQVVVETDRLGLDIGAITALENYQRWRRFDTVQMGVVTDVLNRLFSNDIGPLRMARTIGLGIVDRLPGLKQSFINQAAGRSNSNPALLNGEAI